MLLDVSVFVCARSDAAVTSPSSCRSGRWRRRPRQTGWSLFVARQGDDGGCVRRAINFSVFRLALSTFFAQLEHPAFLVDVLNGLKVISARRAEVNFHKGTIFLQKIHVRASCCNLLRRRRAIK